MAKSGYKGTTIRTHRRTTPGHKPRHAQNPIAAFFNFFSKPTPGYSGRHRNDRQAHQTRGVGHL